MQDRQEERLADCFERVFPTLSRSAIPSATHDNVAGWDSIADLTLVSLIGEEFGFEIDFEDFEHATSFTAVLELIRARIADG